MFGKSKSVKTSVPAERIGAIAARIAPIDYCDESNRRPKRSPSFKQAIARTPGGDEVPVVIKNISATGLRVEYFQSRPLGDRVFIVEPSLPLRAWAQVVWQGNGESGLQIEPTDRKK